MERCPTPAIDLDVDAMGERGLTGITLHPDFTTNKYVYLYYTTNSGIKRNRISRFTFSGDIINPASEVIILDLDPLAASTIHNSGAMKFGPDGKLYVTVGDNSNSDNAQNLDTHKGKMLRLNPDGSAPADNPFASGATEQRKRVWAMGMRNPFTFDIQPGTGRIFINEVGHALWEEIQDATLPGRNFGWPIDQGYVAGTTYTNPFYAYAHGDLEGCAITGGTFFNPTSTNYPSSYIGKYFLMDYCEFWIHIIDPNVTNPTPIVFTNKTAGTPLSIKTGLDGNLYFLSRDAGGSLYKIIYSINSTPAITDQPDDVFVARTQSATINVSASGTPPLSYTWKKNGINITGANSSTYSLSNIQLADSGKYSVVVSNSFGNVVSREAKLRVSSDIPPVASINTPVAGTTYKAGDVISFSGSGTDVEDGTLPATAFTWYIEFHHGTDGSLHVHDGPPIAAGVKNGTYTIPSIGETADEVYYRLKLTVKDQEGFSDTKSVDIPPKKSIITLATNPVNLRLLLDGEPRNTTFSDLSVEGMQRSIGVISPQRIGGLPYKFDRWNHGGSTSQTIITPEADVTYTGIFILDTDLRNPDNPTNATAGLDYKYYEGAWYIVPDFNLFTPVKTGTVSTFNITPRNREDDFAFKFSGYVDVASDGMYTFYTLSNDGSKLYIGNTLVVDNDGEHPDKTVSGAIGLKAGKHAITVGYFDHIKTHTLVVRYSGPGIIKQEIPASKLFKAPTSGNSNTPPSVTITSPANNQQFPDPSNITITANAADIDGSISKVEFYNNSIKLGEDLTAPYEYQWNNVGQGTYILTAKAFDNQSYSTTSSSVTIKVGAQTSTCTAQGNILREYWQGVSGNTVALIPVHTPPSGSQILNIFEGPVNWVDNYGTRFRGYVCAPQTGNYYFWIASNDNGELWLSPDDKPESKIKIAYINTYTGPREWTKMLSQKSSSIYLEAGKKYYIEALQKEGVNNDHISVGWQLPDAVFERPIPGSRLSPYIYSTAREGESYQLSEEIKNDSTYKISVYPNPAEKGMITLSIMGYTGKTTATISIMDMNGNRIYSDKASCDISCARTLINLDERFNPGIYIVYVNIGDKFYSHKLIVK